MTLKYASRAAGELVFQFVLDSIEQKKKSNYLQEIIAMGRTDRVWYQFLSNFFETTETVDFSWKFSMN
ncbi:MAG: hypothetical protein IPQ08_02470 [Chitinophagaceae bacterium]|nr:hypothetical protein [Chitinophagaceae bacterium]